MADRSASGGRLSPLFTWRGAIASEGGPSDLVLEVVEGGEPAERTVKGSTQRHVGLTLSLHMNERGGSCFPGVPRLSRESSLGARSVQRALRALELAGWLLIEEQTTSAGASTSNRYTATIPAEYLDDEEAGGVPRTGGRASPGRGEGVPGTPKDVNEGANVSPTERVVSDAWKANAPPLIEHRDSYLEAAKTKTAIRAALKVYPADAVEAAISNYAAVLAGAEYRWSYKWTLDEFLKRGLDRFVPEAEPLRNFRSGRQTRSEDFDDLPDL